MVEAEATQSNDAPESAPAASIPNWADVRGFQTVSAPGGEPPAEPEAYALELAKELSARSARFAQSVDDSIVLASDGLFRWLGDPVARLVGGDDILKPRAVLLADDALPAEGREAVQARLALWITAHVKKVLGPLEALAEPGAVADPVRELAHRVAQALGVLERERVRQQVKGLDQSARSALRKLGVRFGAFYIYVPALLKPGARTLCSQLWSLRRGVEPGAERLLAFAASGRTSFAAEAPLSPDTYRIAGFRLCGDRVVRVDIVERLTDLIRAAIPDHMRPGGRPPSEAYGFVITPQMTSLTGCAGESFASILRSLGFESHMVKKSEYELATHKAPMEPIAPVVASEAPASDEAQGSDEAIVADASTETHESETVEATDEGAHVPVTAEAASAHESAPEPEVVEAASEPEVVETAPEPEPEPVEAAQGPGTAEAAPGAAEPSDAAPEVAIEAAEPTVAEAETVSAEAVAHESEVVAEAGPDAVADVPATGDDVEIEVWRPAPRRRPQPAARPSAPVGEAEGAARPPRHHREPRRHHGRDHSAATPAVAADATSANVEANGAPAETPREPRRFEGRGEGRHDAGQRHGQRRPNPYKGSRNDEGRDASRGGKDAAPAPVKKEPRPQTIDMDSPFAKLLALKPLLERRDKRT